MELTSLISSLLGYVGTIYGVYYSFKALSGMSNEGYDQAEGTRMLQFWAVLSSLFIYESYFEWFVSFWIPFYSEIKLMALIWLLIPKSDAPRQIFSRILHPSIYYLNLFVEKYIASYFSTGGLIFVRFVESPFLLAVLPYLNLSELQAWDRALVSQSRLAGLQLEQRAQDGELNIDIDGNIRYNRQDLREMLSIPDISTTLLNSAVQDSPWEPSALVSITSKVMKVTGLSSDSSVGDDISADISDATRLRERQVSQSTRRSRTSSNVAPTATRASDVPLLQAAPRSRPSSQSLSLNRTLQFADSLQPPAQAGQSQPAQPVDLPLRSLVHPRSAPAADVTRLGIAGARAAQNSFFSVQTRSPGPNGAFVSPTAESNHIQEEEPLLSGFRDEFSDLNKTTELIESPESKVFSDLAATISPRALRSLSPEASTQHRELRGHGAGVVRLQELKQEALRLRGSLGRSPEEELAPLMQHSATSLASRGDDEPLTLKQVRAPIRSSPSRSKEFPSVYPSAVARHSFSSKGNEITKSSTLASSGPAPGAHGSVPSSHPSDSFSRGGVSYSGSTAEESDSEKTSLLGQSNRDSIGTRGVYDIYNRASNARLMNITMRRSNARNSASSNNSRGKNDRFSLSNPDEDQFS